MRTLKTIVYVDGYNLYYSALTKSPYKWLDLRNLMAGILTDSYPGVCSDITNLKFFTAPIMGKYARDPESTNRQTRYHNALRVAPSGPAEVISGYYSETQKKAFPVDGGPPLLVSVMEEKQTDVNIGLHMYRDVARGDAEQVVLVSGDSDLAPALAMIRDDFPDVIRGVVFPVLSHNSKARRSGQLDQLSTWTRRDIHAEQLEACQLPRSVISRKGRPIIKPDCW